MKIVSFCGPKKVGKDTSADYLIEKGLLKEKLAFATPLKAICAKVFDMTVEEFNNQTIKDVEFDEEDYIEFTIPHFLNIHANCTKYVNYSEFCKDIDIRDLEGKLLKSRRDILQFVGTECIRRKIHPDFHIKAAIPKDLKHSIAVTDTRFVNEYEYLQNNFQVEAFYIERPTPENEVKASNHQSEKEILIVKEKILNDYGSDHILKIKDDFSNSYQELDILIDYLLDKKFLVEGRYGKKCS